MRKLLQARVVAAALIAVALTVFVVQNTSEVQVKWLFFDTAGPVWVVIVVAAAAGAVLSAALVWIVRRLRRDG